MADHIVELDTLQNFNGQGLSNLVWGFSKAEIDHPQLYKKLIDAVLEREDEFSARHIQNLLRWTK